MAGVIAMKVFKYLDSARLDVLEKACIRFTPPHAFNDPFDMRPHLGSVAPWEQWTAILEESLSKIVEEEYEALPAQVRGVIPLPLMQALAASKKVEMQRNGYQLAQTITPKLQETMEKALDRLVGVLCLTEKPDNLLMWAHYAASHQGFVIQFDGTDEFFNRKRHDADDFFHLRKVGYAKTRPSVAISDLSGFGVFLTKAEDWAYEQEWRMMVPLAEATTICPEFPIPVHLFAFPKRAVRAVILGAKASEELWQGVRSIIANDTEYRSVKLFKAQVDRAEYGVHIVET